MKRFTIHAGIALALGLGSMLALLWLLGVGFPLVTAQGTDTSPNWITSYPIIQPTTLDAKGQGCALDKTDLSTSCPGYALDFDGIDDQVNMGNSGTLMLTDSDFTIEVWISTTQTAESTVVHKHDSGWWNGYFINVNYPPCGANKACFYTAEGSSDHAGSTTDVNDGQWHHIAAVYRVSGTKQLFVDGVLEDTKPAPVHITPNTESFRVGSGDTPGVGQFQGLIDEVRLWSIARTQAEIQSTMNIPLVGNEPGLVGYWRFNQGSGQTAYDSTANGNDGRLGSSPGVDDNDPAWTTDHAPGCQPIYLPVAVRQHP